jgi:transposase InsO family protein
MSLSQPVIEQIIQEYSCAPRGAKSAVVKKWAALCACSENRIWAVIPTGRKRKKVEGKAEELKMVAESVFKVKYRVPDNTAPLSTDQAYRIALSNGEIPKEARRYSEASINRMGRELKLSKKTRRVQRFQAERPNEMHHVDASTSQFFYVAKALPDGNYLLKLHGPSQNYKNKPKPLPLGLWIYGIVDDYSGCAHAEYTVAPGESLGDNLKFLERAWSVTDDKVFCGLPEKIKADKGPMMRGKVTEELLARLGVEIDPSVPGAKDSHGKIERPWRTHWQRFEKTFLVLDDWKRFEITLSELNRRLLIYLGEEYNRRPHRYERSFTREQMWRRITFHGGVRPVPKNAFRTAAEQHKRKVRKDGTFSLDNNIYEVKGLHDAWVQVIKGVFDEKMVAQDIETGEKYEVIEFKPNPLGKFTAHKDTPYQKSKKAGADLHISATLFEAEQGAGNVIPLPTRMQEEQPFDHIFDTGAFISPVEAVRDFSERTGLSPEEGSEDRRGLEQLFLENGLRKAFVREIADQYLQEAHRRSSHG